MKTIRKSRLSLAIAASLGGAFLAHDAAAVNLATDGIGEVAIMPYYTTRSGWLSLINLTNVRPYPVAVKVRIHEYQNSRDVLDFNVMLSGYDVFTATIREASDGSGPILDLADTEDTCTSPSTAVMDGLPLNTLAFTGGDNLGSNADGGDTTVDRMREGYVEFIVMGFTGADHTATQQLPEVPFAVAPTAIGNAIENHDCATVANAFSGANILNTARQFGEPINALNFNFRLLNPSRGVEAGGNATTWANFFNEGAAGAPPAAGVELGSPLPSADFRILPQWNYDPANNGTGPANNADACDITRGRERTREPGGLAGVEWDPAGTGPNNTTSCRNLITAQTTYDFLEPSLNDVFPANSGFPGGGACGYEDTRNQGGCIDAVVLGETARVVPLTDPNGIPVLPAGPRGADAISLTIQRATVVNEWSSELSLGTEADWVVTFPTKTFFVDYGLRAPLAPTGGHQFGMLRGERDETFYDDTANLETDPNDGILTPNYPPFAQTFASWTGGVLDGNAGQSCNQVSFAYFDRAENGSTIVDGVIPSPAPVEAVSSLCYEANVITFNGGSVLDSPDAVDVATTQVNPAQAGWMKLRLDADPWADANTANPLGIPAGPFPAGVGIRGGLGGASGLPVVGYMIKQRTFGDVTRNYASAMGHSYERYAPDNLPPAWPNAGPVPDL